jgi:hypothetical protein
MIDDPQVAALVAEGIQESYRLLDDSAYQVRQRCSTEETDRYVSAVGVVCAEIIFKLMEPLYEAHPHLAPSNWNSPPEELLGETKN